MNQRKCSINIGLLSFGFSTYWEQMPGIREEIEQYSKEVENRLVNYGKIINPGLIDTVEKARSANEKLYRENVDIIFVHVATYFPSRIILHALHNLNVPVITLHLQPVQDFTEYTHSAYTLPKNSFSAGGEIGNVLNRSGISFSTVVGRLYDDEAVWNEIEQWCKAASIRKTLRMANIALIGNFYNGMCDLYVDMTRITAKFGVNIEIMEMAQLRKYIECVNQDEIDDSFNEVKEKFSFIGNITKEKLEWNCQVAVGMQKMIKDCKLSAVAIHYNGYQGDIEEKIGYSLTLGGSLLAAGGIPCVAEGDILLTLPMIALNELAGAATQAEINVCDYKNNYSYVGHAGPGDIRLADEKPLLRWLDFFHGKKGSGVSCEFSVKNGQVTLASLIQTQNGDYKLVCTHADSVPGNRLKNGNVNTPVRFNRPINEFFKLWMSNGPSHHSVICEGHYGDLLEKFAKICGIEFVLL